MFGVLTGTILVPILFAVAVPVPDAGATAQEPAATTPTPTPAATDAGNDASPPSPTPPAPATPPPPVALAISTPPAPGPATKPPAPTHQSDGPRYETRIVAPPAPGRTATRMPVPLREIPATVNVITREALEMQGVDDFVGALNNVAGVTPMLTYGAFDFMTIRGFQDFVILDDGIRDERHTVVTSAPMSSLVGIDHIEVVKGPASVLYGMGALGGLINVIRRSPSAQPAYEMTGAAGSYDARRAAMGLTGPVAPGLLGSALLYRLDAGYSAEGDFRGGAIDRSAATLVVDWAVHDGHRLSLRTSYYLNHYSTDAGLPTVPDDPSSDTSLRHIPAGVPLSNRYNTPYDHLRYRSLEALLEYRAHLADGWTLTDRLSVIKTETEYLSAEGLSISADTPDTVDRGYLYFHHQVTPVANQLEVLGRFGQTVSHLATAGYDLSYFHWVTPQALPDAVSISLLAPHETQDAPIIQPTSSRSRYQTMHGFYAQDYVTLHPRVKLLAGGRLDVWHRTTRTDSIAADTGVTSEGISQERQTVAPSYRAGLVLLPADWAVAYGSYGTSFKPVAVLPADGHQLEPELGRQVELGARFDALDRRAVISVAAYQINKTNVVIARPLMQYDQAGEQRSRGAEIDASFTAGRAIITGGYAYTRAVFLNYEADEVVYTGKRPPFVSDHSVTAWAAVRLLHGLSVGGGGRLLSTSYADPANVVPMAAYVLIDAALRYEAAPVTVTLNVHNLLGTNPLDPQGRYFTTTINDNQLTPGPPRTALLQVKLAF
jgi:iron complex outermembrane receptor protein